MSATMISWPEFHVREAMADAFDAVLAQAREHLALWSIAFDVAEHDEHEACLARWADDGGREP